MEIITFTIIGSKMPGGVIVLEVLRVRRVVSILRLVIEVLIINPAAELRFHLLTVSSSACTSCVEPKADFYMGSVNFSCHDASLAAARYRSERIHIMAAEIST